MTDNSRQVILILGYNYFIAKTIKLELTFYVLSKLFKVFNIFQGEELGLVDGYVSWEDTVDPSGCNTNDPINYGKWSRDPERTPFQWNAEKNAGKII